jgi:hypothetical protein
MKPDSNDENSTSTNSPGRRLWVRVLKVLAVLCLVVVGAVAATIAMARASLPNTCAVSEAQFDKVSMQMNYEAAKKAARL